MKNAYRFIILCMLLFGINHANAQGVLRGKVIDDQKLSLPGANVVLQGTNKGSVTDQLGDFTVLGIPAGQYKVVVSYLGYTTEEKEITIQDGQSVDLRFQLFPGTLDGVEIIVFGDRLKGQARALNQQRTNSNITNIVAADQIGRFPDANIGDAMKRIPGITMQNDQGEARDIIIRGMAPRVEFCDDQWRKGSFS
jgi:hypothetical protein